MRRPQTATTGTPALAAAWATPTGGLAAQRLLVERALAGDDQARPLDLLVEAEQVEQVVDARADVGVQEGEGGEADSSRRARAGGSRHTHGARGPVVLDGAQQAMGLGGDGGQTAERGVEEDDVLGGGALLRAVDGRGAVRAQQRVVDVARDGHLDP
ncbi:hypothetical protein GCM10020219_025110 [Nonomuraea dietziae]